MAILLTLAASILILVGSIFAAGGADAASHAGETVPKESVCQQGDKVQRAGVTQCKIFIPPQLSVDYDCPAGFDPTHTSSSNPCERRVSASPRWECSRGENRNNGQCRITQRRRVNYECPAGGSRFRDICTVTRRVGSFNCPTSPWSYRSGNSCATAYGTYPLCTRGTPSYGAEGECYETSRYRASLVYSCYPDYIDTGSVCEMFVGATPVCDRGEYNISSRRCHYSEFRPYIVAIPECPTGLPTLVGYHGYYTHVRCHRYELPVEQCPAGYIENDAGECVSPPPPPPPPTPEPSPPTTQPEPLPPTVSSDCSQIQLPPNHSGGRAEHIKPTEGRVTREFGESPNTPPGTNPGDPMDPTDLGTHRGIRISINSESRREVKATRAGIVLLSSMKPHPLFEFGHHIIIDHCDEYATIYANLQERSVQEGAVVQQGDRIGYISGPGVPGSESYLHYGIFPSASSKEKLYLNYDFDAHNPRCNLRYLDSMPTDENWSNNFYFVNEQAHTEINPDGQRSAIREMMRTAKNNTDNIPKIIYKTKTICDDNPEVDFLHLIPVSETTPTEQEEEPTQPNLDDLEIDLSRHENTHMSLRNWDGTDVPSYCHSSYFEKPKPEEAVWIARNVGGVTTNGYLRTASGDLTVFGRRYALPGPWRDYSYFLIQYHSRTVAGDTQNSTGVILNFAHDYNGKKSIALNSGAVHTYVEGSKALYDTNVYPRASDIETLSFYYMQFPGDSTKICIGFVSEPAAQEQDEAAPQEQSEAAPEEN